MGNRLIVERTYADRNHIERDECVCADIYPDAFYDKDLTKIRIEAIDVDGIHADYHSIAQEFKYALNARFGSNPAMIMPTKIIFNGPATIVFWNDGDKTVVKQSENDIYDYEKGFAMCVVKKVFGTNYSKIRKMCDKAYDANIQKAIDSIEDESIAERLAKIFGKREY